MGFGPRAILLGQDVDAPGVAAEHVRPDDIHPLIPTAEVIRRLLVPNPVSTTKSLQPQGLSATWPPAPPCRHRSGGATAAGSPTFSRAALAGTGPLLPEDPPAPAPEAPADEPPEAEPRRRKRRLRRLPHRHPEAEASWKRRRDELPWRNW